MHRLSVGNSQPVGGIIDAVIDNQLAAQLLFQHKLATQEAMQAYWPLITEQKDIGAILVEKGRLPEQTYRELLAYMQTLGQAATKPQAQANHPTQGPTPEIEVIPGLEPTSIAPQIKPELLEKPETLKKQSAAQTGAQVGSSDASVNIPNSLGPNVSWEELLTFARHHQASDIHLSAGNPILLRRYGSLRPATQAPIEQDAVRKWVQAALTPKQLVTFETKGDLEVIYTVRGIGRYRVTLMKQRRGWDITARVIPDRIRSMEETGLPESCRDLTRWAQGLVLVTGPVGCGKSSTLATFVDMVNKARSDHIISIEEPIEIIYEPVNCRITQRELGPHTLSRDAALRAALREDPDIIVISELRDLDTIRLAISAAETGHLVFGTMNTTNASRTIYRLIDSFPPEEQGIIRNMVSESLRGVVSQQLIPRKDGEGMIPAFEVLLITSAVSNMIRKDEAHQLGTAMITGKSQGMVLLDDSLRTLVDSGLIDPMEAMSRANTPKDFEKYTGRRG